MTPVDTLKRQLAELSANLWWTWNPAAIELFRSIDLPAYQALNHDADSLVRRLTSERIAELAADASFRARLDRIHREMRRYLASQDHWAAIHAAPLRVRPIAYFSAEFGVHESLPIYSGGLGVLAGDHLKSASDLGVPLVGVGLFYRESYFRQRIDRDGRQHAEYAPSASGSLPVRPALDRSGKPIVITVDLTHELLHASVWEVTVGRNRLLLLDTDVPENNHENRALAARLYFGDHRIRIRQELLLGVGGIRALRAAGIHWGVLHLNEGHSAFAPLEWTRMKMEATGASFEACAQEIAQATVFTTHTPVDAGHDRFPPSLVEEHLEPLRRSLGLEHEAFLALGRLNPADPEERLCMTVIAFKMSRHANAVSALHGRVTRRNWQALWPHRREDEVPVGHVTNGVHARSWLAPEMQDLYAKHLGPKWVTRMTDPDTWALIETVHDGELWGVHRILKAQLVHFVRRRLAEQFARAGHPENVIRAAESALDPEVLTIGFARRCATYKRAALLLSDPDRLARLLNNPERPIQLVFAGKAHPNDQPGQDILRQIYQAAMQPHLLGKIVYVEDHDINVGRHLVQGVDVWLNNPRRPQEASGTSGQKVLLNGGLNLSVLDGWWAEAWDGTNGFAIADGDTPLDPERHDRQDSAALYDALEQEVAPLYYNRDDQGIPRGWIKFMKSGIRTLGWRFNTDRMVKDYVRECYLPAAGVSSCRMPR